MSSRLWLALGVISLVIFAISTYLLVHRNGLELLWGYLPLFQFSSFWFGLIAISCRKWQLDDPKTRYLGLSTLTALLLSFGFPPFPFPVLLMVGFVPLLWISNQIGTTSSRPAWSLFFYCFHGFLLWNIWTTYWVANTAYAAGIFANVVNAMLMTIPILLYYLVTSRLGRSVGLVAFCCFWLAFEFLHMRWELYWPWLTLGNGLSTMPRGIQWFEYTGVLGGSLWILSANYLLFDFLSKTEKSKGRLLSLAVALIAPVAISLIVAVGVQESGQEVNVVLVQPNFEPHYEKFHIPDEILVQRFLSLAEEKVDEHTDYLIFPETSFGRVDMDGLKGHNVMLDLQSFLAQYPDLNIVTGLAGYRWLTDRSEQELATSRRLLNSEGQTTYVETYNCAIQMDFDGRISEYYKALFVPGAEFFPFRRILFFLKPLVDKLGGTIAGYRTRSKHNVFAAGDVIAAPAICYESIFGEFMSRFIRKQANVIFIMTNDGWWDNTAGHKQHALFARLRAIELRRGIARSANMGTCCFIDQKGTIYNPTEYGIEQSISGIVQTNDEVTFYASWGDFIGRISLFVAGLLLLRSLVHRFTK